LLPDREFEANIPRLVGERFICTVPQRIESLAPIDVVYTIGLSGRQYLLARYGAAHPLRSLRITTSHIEHSLAITELATQLLVAAPDAGYHIARIEGEPSCHRPFGIQRTLSPDGYIRLVNNQIEIAWFIEMERSWQRSQSTLGKMDAYYTYMKSLKLSELMPRVLFVVFSEAHLRHILRLIGRLPFDAQALFGVTLFPLASAVLAGYRDVAI
jgi:hypothetical protein